jgi:hypothetical protein
VSGNRSPHDGRECPGTVAVRSEEGTIVATGVVGGLSTRGGCVWSDVCLSVGAVLRFRICFARSNEVHTLKGTVVWVRSDTGSDRPNAHCSGVRWVDAGQAVRRRFSQLITGAPRVAPG